MKIIILGAGQVGGTLAENLAGERNDITVIDIDGNWGTVWTLAPCSAWAAIPGCSRKPAPKTPTC